MWRPGGATGARRGLRTRLGPIVAYAQTSRAKIRMTMTSMKTGRSAISPPQSGMTNWDAKLRRLLQICSITVARTFP
jgi:hypothetical protein